MATSIVVAQVVVIIGGALLGGLFAVMKFGVKGSFKVAKCALKGVGAAAKATAKGGYTVYKDRRAYKRQVKMEDRRMSGGRSYNSSIDNRRRKVHKTKRDRFSNVDF